VTDKRISSGPIKLQSVVLPALEKYLAKVSRECTGVPEGLAAGLPAGGLTEEEGAPQQQTLHDFLSSATIERLLKPECRRRGLMVSGTKAELIGRIPCTLPT